MIWIWQLFAVTNKWGDYTEALNNPINKAAANSHTRQKRSNAKDSGFVRDTSDSETEERFPVLA